MDTAEILGKLFSPEGRNDPYPLYEQARSAGPVSPCGPGVVMVVGHREVSDVLRDGDGWRVPDAELRARWEPGFAEHSAKVMLTRSILQSNEPDHGRMRSLVTSVFTARRVAALAPAVTAASDRLVDAMALEGADGDAVDFIEAFAYRLPVGVICDLLGVPVAERHRFQKLAAAATVTLEFTAEDDELRAADAAVDELADFFADLAARRRARPEDDLVTALVRVADADPGRLSDEELLANLVFLLVGGFDTTTTPLGNGLAAVLDRPAVADALRTGSVSGEAFTEEVLRFDPPVQITTRVRTGPDTRIGDVDVPAGTVALLVIGGANRDPRRYEAPHVFDPHRADNRPLSFGLGAHFCVGAQLARLESNIAVPAVLRRFPGLAAAGPAVRRNRLVLRGFRELPVRLGERAPRAGDR